MNVSHINDIEKIVNRNVYLVLHSGNITMFAEGFLYKLSSTTYQVDRCLFNVDDIKSIDRCMITLKV